MNAPTLLGPSARPMVGLGGDGAWKQRNIKGITCSFQWVDLTQWGLEQTNAAMCLYNANRNAMRGAYVVPQQNAYLFGDRAGHPTSHLFASAFAAAEQLGFDMRDKMAIRTVIDIIIEGLPDLILMPSEPPNVAEIIIRDAVLGIEAQAKVNGVVIHEELL